MYHNLNIYNNVTYGETEELTSIVQIEVSVNI